MGDLYMNNLDDLLHGQKTSLHPETPENSYEEQEEEDFQEDTDDTQEEAQDDILDSTEEEERETEEEDKPEETQNDENIDEYGNKEVKDSENMPERLKKLADKMNRQHQAEIDALRQEFMQQKAEEQQTQKEFEFDPDSSEPLGAQLERFVEQTFSKITQKQTYEQQKEEYKQQQAQEQRIQQEFNDRFAEDMQRFDDFTEVAGNMPVSNYMAQALRSMANPAAFIYAAAKQQSAELQRIASLSDPIAQITEMGRLEERMRRNKPTTQAPRPIGRTKEDGSGAKTTKQKEETHRDILASADAGRLQHARNNRR